MTRLNGPPFAVNPDLVQRIDSAPDTILTLVDGTKYIVEEPMVDVISSINEHRSRMIARAQEIQREDADHNHLRSAPALREDHDEDSDDDSAPPRTDRAELALVKRITREDS
ncbi:flagellar FlbD family protein [Sanguibacter antarcticus]|uniref:flagellar FlbD family protein n=1 Tax=Sanguibacter antarcticus TaxID=372484 RepID=UPI001FE8552A|nr:flagellar FlbD family protein [Sanguibacter antarcticus]